MISYLRSTGNWLVMITAWSRKNVVIAFSAVKHNNSVQVGANPDLSLQRIA
jgi:hypothetical protein